MTSPAPLEHVDGNLPEARKRLADAVSAVIDSKLQYVDNKTHWLDGIYQQLRDGLSGSKLDRSGVPQSQPPLWVDAVDLLRDIDTAAAKWAAVWPIHLYRIEVDEYLTVMRLRAIDERSWRPQDVTAMDRISAELEAWWKRADHLLTPGERPKHLPSPCPACGERIIHRQDSGGDNVRIPVLQITTQGCVCQNPKCRTTWGPELFVHLSRVLGYEMPAGVLE